MPDFKPQPQHDAFVAAAQALWDASVAVGVRSCSDADDGSDGLEELIPILQHAGLLTPALDGAAWTLFAGDYDADDADACEEAAGGSPGLFPGVCAERQLARDVWEKLRGE